jgi:hypothetical protein
VPAPPLGRALWFRRLAGVFAVAMMAGTIAWFAPAGAANLRTCPNPPCNTKTPTPTPTTPTPTPTGSPDPHAQWVIDENAKPGTAAWRIPDGVPKGIAGYADHVSAKVGDTVKVYVDTRAASYHVQAFRLGYYQGLGARSIWTSAEHTGVNQPPPTVSTDGLNTVETRWSSPLAISITASWVEGSYLLKLVSSAGGQSYVPLIIRNDASHSALVLQQQVTTWQAYNGWGGYDLYTGADGTFASRSRVVSFDRPYSGRGAGALLNALPFIVLVEKEGLDVTYWTDVDLHERPGLLMNHRALISLDHDEYWSTSMRDGASAARDAGVNIAFLGANAVYRHIRFESSPLGADRHIVCYKSRKEDPLNGVDDAEVTVSWRNAPVNLPESALLGPMYDCPDTHGDVVVADASVWVFAGTGMHDGDTIPDGVDLEVDKIFPGAPTPTRIQILAHSPIACPGRSSFADMTYYTTRGHAGVFDASSQGWFTKLQCGAPVATVECDQRAVRITENVLLAFGTGPAGDAHPSVANASSFGYTLTDPTDP